MPAAAARREGDGDGDQPSFFRTALQSIAIFALIQLAMKFFSGGLQAPNSGAANVATGTQPATAAKVSIPPFAERPHPSEYEDKYGSPPQWIAPIWGPDISLDIRVRVSPSLHVRAIQDVPEKDWVLNEKAIGLYSWDDTRVIETSFPVPKEVQNNGTLWAHIYVTQSASALDTPSAASDSSKSFFFVRPLNQFHKKKKAAKVRNLLSDTDEPHEEEDASSDVPGVIASYYHPNFTMSIVPDSGTQSYIQMHPAIREFIQLERTGARDVSGKNTWYYPIVFLNTFWQLRSHMTEINSTVDRLPLNIHLNHLSNWKFSIVTSMDFGMKQQVEKASQGQTFGGGSGSEFEEVKRILLDSNMYLLATTVIVSILHTVFEMLAFKNDVSHWRKKKDNVGVSVRTILANIFMQAVIFLYLLDNNENTSYMILVGQGFGMVLEAWKITKTVNVRVRPTTSATAMPWRVLPYTVVFEDKHKLSETELKTQEYDQIAFKYMYIVGVPLLVAYAVYSLVYETHKSWYSFVITTLVGSVYAYGFLLMVPSLYINYRLKSVAHMPGKAMTYKVLSTFVDDLFAFTIKMPTLHRLATLRDDVIFFVYLYQSWAYKVDYSRVNEFGQGGNDADDDKAAEATAAVGVSPHAASAAMASAGAPASAAGHGAVKASGRDDAHTSVKRK